MSVKPALFTTPEPAARAAADRHIQHLMDAERRLARSQYGADGRRRPRAVGIVGAGVMGSSIAAAAVRHQIPVVLIDESKPALDTARRRIASWLNAPSTAGDEGGANVERLVRLGSDLAEAAGCDLVIESVAEKTFVKQELLTQLERLLPDRVVLATNTSTIPLARLSAPLRDPGRLCGCHFFLPIGQGPMLEIVRSERTQPETVAAAVDFAEAIGHLPLVVADVPGFVVNRLLVPHLSAAMQLLAEGASVEAVEAAAEDFGMLRGPCRLMDMIGLDTAVQCGAAIAGSSSGLVVGSPLLVAMVKARQLGRKTRAGFFLYDSDDPAPRGLNPAWYEALARHPQTHRSHSAEAMCLRLLAPMLVEASRMLECGRVRDAGQIDLAILLGFGFPASRGGLLYWADQVGVASIVEWLGSLGDLGPRVQPTPWLLEMARQEKMFYP